MCGGYHRKHHLLLDGGLRVRTPPVHRQALLVHGNDDHADAQRSRHACATLYSVQHLWVGRFVPADQRAEIPRDRCLLRVSAGTVHAESTEGDRGGSDCRWMHETWGIPAYHPAALSSRFGDDSAVYVSVDMG